MPFLKSLRLDGLLSFPPGSEPIPLQPLNVLIGPNGSGKSNLIEGIELLHATPTGFASAIREGGGVREWLWKGEDGSGIGTIEAYIEPDDVDQYFPESLGVHEDPTIQQATKRSAAAPDVPPMDGSTPGPYGSMFSGDTEPEGDKTTPKSRASIRYKLSFAAQGSRVEIIDEIIEDSEYSDSQPTVEQMYLQHVGEDADFYYHFRDGNPVVNVRSEWLPTKTVRRDKRDLDRKAVKPDESILMQLKDQSTYPELTELGRQFGRIQAFREWTFGHYAEVRKPQRPDPPFDVLEPDSQNLGSVLSHLQLSERWSEFNQYLTRFLPRFERCTITSAGGQVQIYIHESGLKQPIPATRLSDGTIRFMAILAQLLSPTPPPLICMEEPELGLHPDAIALLATLLQEASARTQLIVTTHSDALVSALTEVADSVMVCEYQGGTVLKRIESEKLRFWLEKYQLGEIWRIGEIGGNL